MDLKNKIRKISNMDIDVTASKRGVFDKKEYKYSSLKDMKKALRPVLEKEEIGYSFDLNMDSIAHMKLVLEVFYKEETDTTTLLIERIDSNQNIFMGFGAGLTHYKKFMLGTKFNLMIGDDDDDDTGGTVHKTKVFLKAGSDEYKNVIKTIKNNEATLTDAETYYIIDEKTKGMIMEATI